jgi:predicted ATPase/tRNA A-37 threonylcarbamoyl transferase component Bud32
VLKDAIRRFEDAWRRGDRPALEDYLPAGGGLRFRLLIELAHIDLELRLKGGEAARAEHYLARYPELGDDSAAAVELLAAEYELRRRVEPGLGLDDVLQRFPQYRAALEQAERATVPAGAVRPDTPARPAGPGAPVPPEVAGYEVLELLGKGGMGVVYKARQKSLHRMVALKLLPEACAQDPVWLHRFRHEARTASALNHPHICTIYDTGDCSGRPYLSMELIEGRTLEALVGQGLPARELARLLAQAARALQAAHAVGVVHRDIKPANLMVRDDGLVKVLDFGLAHRLPTGEPGSWVASGLELATAGWAGTPLYMSPEQVRGEAVGSASDVFSLGLVLYELATGRHPFPADTVLGVPRVFAAQPAVPAGRLNAEVPAALDGLIQRMLAPDPRLRPTAADVDAALTELAHGAGRPGGMTSPGRSPTVGREQERAALRAGFELAAGGRGQLLCVTGEPGLGKTTLVEDFLEDLAAGGRLHSAARGRCSERLAGAEAYLPLLEALDSLLRGDGGGSIAPVMQLVAPAWYAQLAPLGADDPPSAGAPADGGGPSQQRLKRELGLLLQELSRLRPLVLFLDDVHWADPSTVDLLAYLGVRCAGLRLLLILAYRPTDLALSQHPFGPVQLDLQARGLCREISLGFLEGADIERYLALRFAANDFPGELPALIHRRTEGNPLFLADLLQYLCDKGVIVAREGRWGLAGVLPDLQRELPESVRSLIRRKIDRLGRADRRLLMAAAVQGHEFDAAVIARALGRDGARMEERLAELHRTHGLVRPLREHELPSGTLTVRYAFVHGLYQNALYGALQPARKAALSAAVAQALVDCYGEPNPGIATELALLLEAARELPRAAEAFLRAAGNAVRVSAYPEAIALARRGLALLQALPDTPARARQELTLLIALGVALVATQGFASPEVEQTYLRAQALCQQTQDVAALVPVLYGLWNVYLVRCELSRCQGLAAQMFVLAQGQADSVFLLVAHNVLQQPLFHRGDPAAARRHQEQGLALYDRHQHRTLTAVYGEDPGVGCLVYGAVTLWHLGYPEQALDSARAGLSLAEELSNPFNQAQALYYGAFLHLCRREVRHTLELAGALMDLCREHGIALLLAGGQVLRGWGLAGQGQVHEGISQMRKGLESWRDTGALSHRPCHLALLAEALASTGQVKEGLTLLAEALALSSTTGERFYEAELHRLRGELLNAPAEADACYRQALDVAGRQGVRPFQLRAAMSLCRLHRGQDRQAEARQLLAGAYGHFSEGFDTLDLQQARAILEAPPPP